MPAVGWFRERRLLKVMSTWEAALGFGREQTTGHAHTGKSVPQAPGGAVKV